MTGKWVRTAAAAAVAIGCTLLPACTSGGIVIASATGQPTPGSGGSSRFERVPATPGPSASPTFVDPVTLEALKADLSTRGVDVDDLRVVSSRAVTWSDGSLGCPDPGSLYTQALVPGAEIIVESAGQRYDYHVGGDALRLCTRTHAAPPDNANA